jgi:hypothetical protein
MRGDKKMEKILINSKKNYPTNEDYTIPRTRELLDKMQGFNVLINIGGNLKDFRFLESAKIIEMVIDNKPYFSFSDNKDINEKEFTIAQELISSINDFDEEDIILRLSFDCHMQVQVQL